MKKQLLMSLSVLLLPVAMQAQTQAQEFHTTSGPGYIPPYTQGTTTAVKEAVHEVEGISFADVHTILPPIPTPWVEPLERAYVKSAKKVQEKREAYIAAREEAKKALEQAYVEIVQKVQEKREARKAAREEAKKVQEETALKYGFCLGIYEALEQTPETVDSVYGEVALEDCKKTLKTWKSPMNTCPVGQDVEVAKETAKSWWQKNVVDNYKEGYRHVGESYMAQSAANHKTLMEVRNLFARISAWLCGE